MRTIGNFLLLFSLFLIIKTFTKPVTEEVRYFLDQQLGKTYTLSEDLAPPPAPKGLLAKALNLGSVEVMTPADSDFGIVIPKIGANANIIANVDPGDEPTYLEALQQGVAHAAGTSFPGDGGHIFLFAHSTDYFWNVGAYNAIFYLLSKLQESDEVNLFFQGKRFVYKVESLKIVDPSEVEYLTRKTDNELLTLQTCWPPGTTLRRLLVFARRVAE